MSLARLELGKSGHVAFRQAKMTLQTLLAKRTNIDIMRLSIIILELSLLMPK